MNSNRLLLLIGAALAAGAEVFTAAAEASEETTGGAPAASGGEDDTTEAPKRRGRPPGVPNKPAATPVEKPQPETPAAFDPVEHLASLQKVIAPYVDDAKGQQVKKIIAKFSATGLKDIKPEDVEAFKKDLATLDY